MAVCVCVCMRTESVRLVELPVQWSGRAYTQRSGRVMYVDNFLYRRCSFPCCICAYPNTFSDLMAFISMRLWTHHNNGILNSRRRL